MGYATPTYSMSPDNSTNMLQMQIDVLKLRVDQLEQSLNESSNVEIQFGSGGSSSASAGSAKCPSDGVGTTNQEIEACHIKKVAYIEKYGKLPPKPAATPAA